VRFQRVSPGYLLSPQDRAFRQALRIALFAVAFCSFLFLTGCGGSGSSSPALPGSQIQIAISPATVTLSPSAQQQFTATVQGTANSAVTWASSAGAISSAGIFTAPGGNTVTQVTVTATSVSDSSQRASSVVSVEPGTSKLQITTSSLSAAFANTSYSASIGASGGAPPYKWSLSAGSLPQGIALQANGAVTGVTSKLGNFTFTVKVTDAASNSATQSLMLPVQVAGAGSFDGPAELPRVYLNTTMADTPAPGPVVNIAANGDLQTALNNATCGEVIELQAGATFSGKYIFPAKSCDDQHWIMVRTSAADAMLCRNFLSSRPPPIFV